MLCNYKGDDIKVEIEINGLTFENGANVEYYLLDDNHDLTLERSEVFLGSSFKPVVTLKNNSIILVKLRGY